jgi:hypothetical protein
MRRRPSFAGIGAITTLTCGWIVTANIASGLPSTHSPFFPEEDYTLPLNTCDPVQRVSENMHPASGSVTFAATDGATLTLTMSTVPEPYTELYFAQVTQGPREVTPRVQVPLVSTVLFLLPTEAICEDLNGDGITDFVTDHSRHGNGLGASFYDRLVVLSSSSGGYRFWIMNNMNPSPEDFVGFGQIEPIVMVTTSFANSEGAIPHSYYVYDLWSFRDGEVVSANDLDNRFPKWVWMTVAENHMPASSLSLEEKQRMLDRRAATEIPTR